MTNNCYPLSYYIRIMTKVQDHIENDKKYTSLTVNKGIVQPPVVNPNLQAKRTKKQVLSINEFLSGILQGNIAVLSQAVTLVESSKPEHQAIAQELIEKCLPYAGKSYRIGITGVPGAGKSSFIETLGMHITKAGKKLAVLAIDPSSERTKGSILGDKTRMEELSVSKNAFIRPSPAAGSLGGVARKTRETIVLCEAAGFDTIFVETVGVGQSEIAVHSMVDFFLLIQLSGTGDELQGIKRGIMEMADGIIINKADGQNIDKANLARNLFQNALHLFPKPESGWDPQVLTCSSIEKRGITETWDMITSYSSFTKTSSFFEHKRSKQSKYWMYESINEQLKTHFYDNKQIQSLLIDNEKKVLNNEISSFVAANDLLNYYFNKEK